MASLIQPVVDEWYKLPNTETFRITAIDADHIEIQYPDGAVESLEKAAWYQLEAIPIALSEEGLKAIDDDLRELSFLTQGTTFGAEIEDFHDLYGDLDLSI